MSRTWLARRIVARLCSMPAALPPLQVVAACRRDERHMCRLTRHASQLANPCLVTFPLNLPSCCAAAYRPDERPQVQVAQAMYAEVQAALAATPQISEVGCFVLGLLQAPAFGIVRVAEQQVCWRR